MRTVIRQTTPTTRTTHRCSGCREQIRPGDTYTRQELAGEGTIEVWKSCGRCVPGEENLEGHWLRPHQLVRRCVDSVEEWGGLARPYEWDGVAWSMESKIPHRNRWRRFEAIMVPLVGLSEWVEVRR